LAPVGFGDWHLTGPSTPEREAGAGGGMAHFAECLSGTFFHRHLAILKRRE
jgi:hypothetical protein